jgi:tRNA A37 threonylcarbamoyladenosine biosynthesis protein TsaE
MDLYRLSGHINDLLALDLDYVFSNCISLIEWPSRLGEALPSDRLEIHITIPDQQVLPEQEDCPRQMLLQPFGNAWYERLNHLISEGYVDDLIVEEE